MVCSEQEVVPDCDVLPSVVQYGAACTSGWTLMTAAFLWI